MNIKVCKLSKDMAEDYIFYFDNRAFEDGDIEKGCYCVWHDCGGSVSMYVTLGFEIINIPNGIIAGKN